MLDGTDLTGLEENSGAFPNGAYAGLARNRLQRRMVTSAVSIPRNRQQDQSVSIVADFGNGPRLTSRRSGEFAEALIRSCQFAEQKHAQVRSWLGAICQCA